MTRKLLIFASVGVVAAMTAAGIATALALPPGARLPVHWNAAWRPDGYMGRWTAPLAVPVLAAIIFALLAALPRMEPQRSNFARSQGLYLAAWTTTLIVLVAADLMILGAAWRTAAIGPRSMVGAIGVAFVVLGNQLAKSRPMGLIGIRTPWTRADTDVWIATHRMGGMLMVGAGLAWFVAAVLGLVDAVAMRLLAGVLLAAALLPAGYSWWVGRRRGEPVD